MGEIVLYHGSFNKVVVPQYGLGETKHDYGKGFYLPKMLNLLKNGLFAGRTKQTVGFISLNWILKI